MNRAQLSSLLICSLVLVIALTWYAIPHPVIGLALCLVPLAALAVIRHLFWLILLFVLFSFFRIHEVFPQLMPLKLPFLFSAGALASLLWHSTISRSLKLYWHPSMRWLVLFWALVTLGIVFASNRDIAINTYTSVYWKIMLMSLAIMWVVNSAEQLAKMCWAIVLCGAMVAMVAISNAINGIGLVEGSRVTIGRHIGSMLGDPNDLALVLLFPLAFSVSLLFSNRLNCFSRLSGLMVAIALMIAIIETQSRGGLLGMIAVVGLFLSQAIRSKVLLGAIASVGMAALYVLAGISSRASGGAAEAGIDASAMGRIYAWEAAAKMALDNPLTGVGLNNFYSNYFYYSSHWDGLNHAVHSTWFGVLAETGMLGLIVFVVLIISLWRTALRSQQTLIAKPQHAPYLMVANRAVLAGLAGTVVSGTFLTQGFVWPIYILAALIIAVSQICSRQFES